MARAFLAQLASGLEQVYMVYALRLHHLLVRQIYIYCFYALLLEIMHNAKHMNSESSLNVTHVSIKRNYTVV